MITSENYLPYGPLDRIKIHTEPRLSLFLIEHA